jgi:hypothetical protein
MIAAIDVDEAAFRRSITRGHRLIEVRLDDQQPDERVQRKH